MNVTQGLNQDAEASLVISKKCSSWSLSASSFKTIGPSSASENAPAMPQINACDAGYEDVTPEEEFGNDDFDGGD